MSVIELLHIFSRFEEGLLGVLLHFMNMLYKIFHRVNGGLNSRKRTNVGVVTVIRIEGGCLQSCMIAIVEGEFNYRKPIDPIILVIGDYRSKGLFDFLVGSF